jgi:hypothetical protein
MVESRREIVSNKSSFIENLPAELYSKANVLNIQFGEALQYRSSL